MNLNEYNNWKEVFFPKYEATVRNWLVENGTNLFVANNMPFFRDGAVQPKIWFSSEVRPLFILKEVNTGIKADNISEIENEIGIYNKKWGVSDTKYFNFVENKFDDIQIGKFATWKKIVRLGIKLTTDNETYKTIDLNAKYGIDVSENAPQGYQEGKYKYSTQNCNYISAVNQIAVIDIKKIGAGNLSDSIVSKQCLNYMEHLSYTKELIVEQISILNPTVIISCCGPENDEIIKNLYDDIKLKLGKNIDWYKVNHPSSFWGGGLPKQIEFCDSIIKYE